MAQGSHHYRQARNAFAQRQPYYRPHTSLGAAGHWIKEVGILAPIAIGQFVPDPERKWRYINFISLATALLSQGMWTMKIHKEREWAREHRLGGDGRQ
jgi:hypothetical protein